MLCYTIIGRTNKGCAGTHHWLTSPFFCGGIFPGGQSAWAAGGISHEIGKAVHYLYTAVA